MVKWNSKSTFSQVQGWSSMYNRIIGVWPNCRTRFLTYTKVCLFLFFYTQNIFSYKTCCYCTSGITWVKWGHLWSSNRTEILIHHCTRNSYPNSRNPNNNTEETYVCSCTYDTVSTLYLTSHAEITSLCYLLNAQKRPHVRQIHTHDQASSLCPSCQTSLTTFMSNYSDIIFKDE